jgi:hypothetical protein
MVLAWLLTPVPNLLWVDAGTITGKRIRIRMIPLFLIGADEFDRS